MNDVLAKLKCGNAKHAYFGPIRAFSNWVAGGGILERIRLRKWCS